MEKTYTQQQLNAIAKSYDEETSRLLTVKANRDLAIFDRDSTIHKLRLEIAEKDKLISELQSKIPVEA